MPPATNGEDRADAAADIDLALGFTVPGRNARGRLVRLGPLLGEILAAHDYPEPIRRVLSESLILTALLGATLKEAGGQLTLQAQTESGAVELLVCDYRAGALRGYARFDPERLAETPSAPSLFALFGRGYLAITFDQAASGERYQGIVPLEGASLAGAAESYFAQSEQIPSLVRLAADGNGIAGGLLLQHLPEGEEGRERLPSRLDHPEWEHVKTLAATVTQAELAAAEPTLEELLWRLFHEEEEVRLLPRLPLRRGCRCDADYIREVIARFDPDEKREMADEEGIITVDCQFCARMFPIPLAEIDN